MTGSIRRRPVRRALTALGGAVAAWIAWRLVSPEAPPGEAMAAVLGWGLGLIPVHVTLRAPRGRTGRRAVRRPARDYERRAGGASTGGRERRVRPWHRKIRKR